jgi:O-antigen/teichoic acid export membrane protein
MVAGLWLTPFYLHMLGQRDYGLWLAGFQVLTFLLIVDFGIVGILPRDIAQLSGKLKQDGNWGELISLVHTTSRVVLWQTIIVSALSLGAYLFWPGISPDIRGPLAVAIGAFCLSFPLRMYVAVLEGLQDLQFISQLRMALWALSTALTVVLFLFGHRLYSLAIGWGFNVVAMQAAALLRLRLRYPALVSLRSWFGGEHLTWRDFTRGSWLSVGQISQAMVGGADVIAVANALGPAAVVPYNCTRKLSDVLQNQPQLLALSALPGLSHMKTSETPERILEVATSLGQAMLILSGAVVAVVYSCNESFVRVWVGSGLYGGSLLTSLFLVSLLLRHLDLSLSLALFAMGHERSMAIKTLADAVVSAVLSFTLVRWFGLSGAIFGPVAGALLIGLPINTLLAAREFRASPAQVVLPYFPLLWRTAAICWVGQRLAGYAHVNNYLELVALGAAVGALYCALVIPYAVRTPLWGYFAQFLGSLRSGFRNKIALSSE